MDSRRLQINFVNPIVERVLNGDMTLVQAVRAARYDGDMEGLTKKEIECVVHLIKVQVERERSAAVMEQEVASEGRAYGGPRYKAEEVVDRMQSAIHDIDKAIEILQGLSDQKTIDSLLKVRKQLKSIQRGE